jgi:iron complex outermembrane receptor protein
MLLVCGTGTAVAQDAAAGDSDQGIQDIIVTAQKRGQSGQDVGITLSVVTGDALAQRGATSVTEITTMVPNVQANYGAGQVAFNVRGIGTNELRTAVIKGAMLRCCDRGIKLGQSC